MQYTRPLLATILLTCTSMGTALAQCGTLPPTEEHYSFVRDVVSQIDVTALRNAGTTCIPMQAHIVRMNDGSGGISHEDLNIGVSFLNDYFLDAGIEFFWKGEPNYANNSDYFEFDEQAPDNDTEGDLVALFTTAGDAVNIYFVNNITTSSGFSAAGYAYFPFNSTTSNRVVMRHGSTANTPQGTFVHEFGHYFDLFHTHEGTEFGNMHANAENVPRSGPDADCMVDGDLLCDTEADPRYNGAHFDQGTCTDTGGEVDEDGVPYVHPVDNIMSYYPDQCVNRFTPEQYTRMMQGLVQRQGHSAYNLNASPMTVTAASGLTATVNGSQIDLTWTDNAGNEMGYLIERSTTSATMGFKALSFGGTAPNATSWSDTNIGSNITYWYRIKASNGDCNTYSNVATVTTSLAYCAPQYNSPCDDGTAVIIDTFTMTGEASSISNVDSDCSAGGFGDFTAMNVNLNAGTTYNFVADALEGFGSYFPAKVQVFIDLDQNGSFEDAGEQMLATSGDMTPAYNGMLTIPVTALNGTTRMRVRASDPWNPCTGGDLGPCNQCIFGETEDYSVTISGGVSAEITIAAKVFLEGPYNGTDMDDALRTGGYIPSAEPYTALFGHTGDGGGETVAPAVLAVTGNNAIVDWIYVELRDKNDNSSVVNTRSALIQRDGDIVDVDGISPVSFTSSSADDYYVAIRHRNHLGTMSITTVSMNPAGSFDFTGSNLSSYGTLAKKDLGGGVYGLWMGNCDSNNEIKYTGLGNDRDPILVAVGGSVPTNTVSGYFQEDANMDGEAKYTGLGNDRDPILVNVGGSVPTNVKVEQLP